MTAYILCLTSSGGIPVFVRKKGDGDTMPFSKMASLNGVHMFLKSQNMELLCTDMPDTSVVWKEFEESILLIAIASGTTNDVLNRFLEAVFSAMILIVGIDEIKNPRNVERLKRDLRVCNPIIDRILECLDIGDRICTKTDLIDMTDSIMSPENHLLQNCLEGYMECLDSLYGCILVHGCLAVATESWWSLDPIERKLLILASTTEGICTARDLPVFLPNKSPNVAFRLVSVTLVNHVEVLALCGPTPELAETERQAIQCWRSSIEILRSAEQSYPRNFPASISLDSEILGFLLANYSVGKFVLSRNSHNSKNRVSGAHRLDILRTFYYQAVETFLLSDEGTDDRQVESPKPTKEKIRQEFRRARETYWCSEYHKCHAVKERDHVFCVLYTSTVPTYTMRLITQKTFKILLADKQALDVLYLTPSFGELTFNIDGDLQLLYFGRIEYYRGESRCRIAMDVDLLRPGTVPISPDTILWFEFLLNPSLLHEHLSKPLPDPSPTDLMIKFMTINLEQRESDTKSIDIDATEPKQVAFNKWSHKNLALKILSLKVAAYLKWDLDTLETKLPLPMQVSLLQDLFYIATDSIVEVPVIPEFPSIVMRDQILFTVVLYYRWHLRAIVYKSLNNRQIKQPFIHIPGIQEATYVPPGITDEIMRKLETYLPNTINTLNAVLELNDIKAKVPSYETFVMLTEDSTECSQNWENMYSISVEEFKCQIHYDLAVFHLLKEDYPNAKLHIGCAKELFNKLDTSAPLMYCTIQKDYLDGYCLACEIPVEHIKPDLMQQMHASVKDQYTNIVQVLQADNVTREIPQVYRDNLELDIQGGMVNRTIIVARDLLIHIQCLNLVRKVLESEILLGDYIAEIKTAGSKGLNTLFWAFSNVIEKVTETDRKRISRFLLYLISSGDIEELAGKILNDVNFRKLFDDKGIEEVKRAADQADIDMPELLTENKWGIQTVTYSQNSRVDVGVLEQRIILSYNPLEIRDLLISLASINRRKPLWRINSCWELPIPLQSVAMSLPRGLLQDYSYVLLAKSRELVTSRDFVGAKDMLNVLDQEAQQHAASGNGLNFKLSQLVAWEILLIEILHCFHIWPATNLCDMQALIGKCKQCLGALQATDQVIPRQEIIEYCTVFLLNMAEWDYLTSLEKRWNYSELAAAISGVCQDIVKYKGSRKFPREAWDIVLAVFGPSSQQPQKRGSSGSSTSSASREAVIAVNSTLNRLREPTALAVATSLLARLHNVLRDESSLELHTQYSNLWPATVPNSNSYNTRSIGEALFQLLTQALKYYPSNISWLKLMADLNFVLGYYESAMKYYLEATMVASDLFSQPVPRTQIDDMVYRRMIKCCAHLQCYTQAAVLCQFLEEVDYALAFKIMSSDQKSCAAADAMDAYYHCIWDTTIIEFLIHLHTKRGEHHRKQLAIKVIGLLELNSNNNEEIQREAANIRKAKFLRALAKQYVY